jgi:DNA adenine methylase
MNFRILGAVARETSPGQSHETQPLLRWAGSKKRQFNALKHLFPRSFETYIEPFAGSASFLFRLSPRRAKINDINADLYDFYREVKINPLRLYRAFLRIPRTAHRYYEIRTAFNSLERGRKRVTYFYFLNRNCFNGIYRINGSGQFNVPFSDQRVSPYPTLQQFIESCEVIRKAKVYNMDFEAFCRTSVSHGDFVYLDPPYYRTGSRIFNEYGFPIFTLDDFDRLDKTLRRLDRVGALFLLSLPRTREAISLAQSWHSTIRFVRRTVAGNPIARRKQAELMIFNYDK